MTPKFIAVFLALLLCSSASIAADIAFETRRAQKMLAEGDYQGSYAAYLELAEEKDNPLAQMSLAQFYQNGWGRTPDPLKACQWYERAAKSRQLPAAADALARCHVEGTLGEVDYARALEWYQVAADLGHHYSLCHLGDLYLDGLGTPADPQKGMSLCRQSAEQGSTPAMLHLAQLYRGRQEVRDPGQAMYWYQMAASAGVANAQYQLGVMLRDGESGEPSPADALYWFELAAAAGHGPAHYETAILYFDSPADPETGGWYPEYLAKAYMWISASKAYTQDEKQLARLDEMRTVVMETMPPSWVPELDAKIAEHISNHPPDNLTHD